MWEANLIASTASCFHCLPNLPKDLRTSLYFTHGAAIPSDFGQKVQSKVKTKKTKWRLTLDGINPHTKSSKLLLSGSSPQGGLTKVIVVDWLVGLG